MHDPLTHLNENMQQSAVDLIKGSFLVAGAILEVTLGTGLAYAIALFGLLHMFQAALAMSQPAAKPIVRRPKVPLKQGKAALRAKSPPPLPNNILPFSKQDLEDAPAQHGHA